MRHDPDLKGLSFPAICLLLFFFCLSNGANSVHAQTRAYVAHPADDTISVINTDTNTVITTIPVGDGPLAVAITPDGTRAYPANQVDSTQSAPIYVTYARVPSGVMAMLSGNKPTGIVAITKTEFELLAISVT